MLPEPYRPGSIFYIFQILFQQEVFDEGFKVGFGHEADFHPGVAGEGDEKDGGDGTDAVAAGEGAGIIHIDLIDLDFPGIFGGNLVNERGELAARTAPVRIEIDYGRDFTEIFPFIGGEIFYIFLIGNL